MRGLYIWKQEPIAVLTQRLIGSYSKYDDVTLELLPRVHVKCPQDAIDVVSRQYDFIILPLMLGTYASLAVAENINNMRLRTATILYK
jgi:hypothetical protein